MEPMRASIIKSQIDIYGEKKRLDVAILHAPWCWQGHCTREQEEYGWRNAWKNLEVIHKEGDIAAIGVSNFGADDLLELLKFANTRVAVVQNWMDPFRQDKHVREICKEYGIAYMAYSSMGGQWEHIIGYNPVLRQDENTPGNPTLTAIAEKHRCSVASVVYSWVLNEDVVAIPRSSKAVHIQHDAGLLDQHRVFLDEEDMRLIRLLDGTKGRH
jgi:diketogulonate reductase-like aldo/keto reductase